jgi:hypothetical protein
MHRDVTHLPVYHLSAAVIKPALAVGAEFIGSDTESRGLTLHGARSVMANGREKISNGL